MDSVTRRNILKAGGTVATSGAALAMLLESSSEPVLAVSGFTANDVSVSSNDGDLNTLTIAPEVTIEWSGWASAVATIEVTWHVMTTSTSETTVGSTPYTFDVSSPSSDGQISRSISTINLLSANGGALDASNFDAETDGGSNTTDVELSMDCTLKDSGSNVIASRTDILGPKTFSVTVNNATSSLSASSTANTDGS